MAKNRQFRSSGFSVHYTPNEALFTRLEPILIPTFSVYDELIHLQPQPNFFAGGFYKKKPFVACKRSTRH